jgi:hypothetical protein
VSSGEVLIVGAVGADADEGTRAPLPSGHRAGCGSATHLRAAGCRSRTGLGAAGGVRAAPS